MMRSIRHSLDYDATSDDVASLQCVEYENKCSPRLPSESATESMIGADPMI